MKGCNTERESGISATCQRCCTRADPSSSLTAAHFPSPALLRAQHHGTRLQKSQILQLLQVMSWMLLYSLPMFKRTLSENSLMPNVSRSCTTAKLALTVPFTMLCHHMEHFAPGLSAVLSQAIAPIHVGKKDLGLLHGLPLGKGEGGSETCACCTGVTRMAEGAICS